MRFVTGSPKGTWQPIMTADTTTESYWLNWRVLVCAILVLFSAIISSLIVLKYEVSREKARNGDKEGLNLKETSSTLYEDEIWRPCLKGIHPVWLLGFRVFAFVVLLVLLILTATEDGGSIFYFYTQWTFAAVTIYFGLGSLLSMHGCYQHLKKASGDKVGNVDGDAEQGIYDASTPPQGSNPSNHEKGLGAPQEHLVRQPASTWGYIFQILFQMIAGAVMLTDCVFWFIIVPFLTIKDYNINLLIISMHTINAVFLIGDTALNSLRFPWFRIGYFCMWTITYVLFQWIVHAIVKLWWPYPFLDLSSPYAPLCYFSMALLHIPCYGIFALIMKLKHSVLSTRYPDSYLCVT
uniref:Transmembrane protein n=1 Tax=Glycine max TaxID=3847 RepID=C6T7Z1_SOYBN|nr:unknown [Glycine max]